MPKINRGRLDGVYGMTKRTASELHAWADDLEAQIQDPENMDDPKWLQRRADEIRVLAKQKEKSLEHKGKQ